MEKLPFNGKKPLEEPESGWDDHLPWPVKGEGKGKRTERHKGHLSCHLTITFYQKGKCLIRKLESVFLPHPNWIPQEPQLKALFSFVLLKILGTTSKRAFSVL